jgi:predicted dehydrogenase
MATADLPHAKVRALIRTAVFGAGHWGPNLIRHFDNQQTSRVTWVVDTDASRLEQVKLRFPDVRVTTDAHEALADSEVDAVVIATPVSTHHALAKRALELGKHVLVEKPITADVAEGEELRRLADENGLVLMVGHVFVFNAGIQWIKQYLQGGELGRVYYVSAVRTNLGPIRMDVNAAWDLAAHDISITNWWLDSEPEAVSAAAGAWINPGIDDAVFATLEYPGDVRVNLHVSWLNPRKARDITVVGESKMLTWDDLSLTEPVRVYDKAVTDQRTRPGFIDSYATFRASVRDGDIHIPKIPQGEPLKAECEHFIACVANGEQPLTGAAEGVSVVRTLSAMDRSIAAGGARQLVGDEVAA